MKYLTRVWVIALAATAILAQPKPQPLFKPLPAAQASLMMAQPDSPAATALQNSPLLKRSRLVSVDFSLIGDAAASAFSAAADSAPASRPRLLLNLFEDVAVTVDIREVHYSADGRTVIWQGTAEGAPRSEVTISKSDDASSAAVSLNGKFYQVRPVAGSTSVHVVQEINRDAYPKEGKPLPARGGGPRPDLAMGADSGDTIDVMVLYTPAAKIAAGGQTAIELLIENAAADANTGYANSHLTHTVRVVHKEEVAYDEASGFEDALTRLAGSADGVMDQIHQLRNQYGADMVSLFINNTQYCGLAYLLRDLTQDFSGSAFSVVHWDCAVGNHSFAHEMGHNLGADHDRANGCSGLFPYSCGYQHAPQFRTIMAYPCAGQPCPRENYWSSPEIFFLGIATGIVQGAAEAADNVTTLKQTVPIAARWRTSAVTPQTSALKAPKRGR
jgi:peptidyl-Asp metalloendopeptidase